MARHTFSRAACGALVTPLVALVVTGGVAVGLVGGTPGVAAASKARTAHNGPGTVTRNPDPIQHVIVILQENHSFDNVLGSFCADVASGLIVRPGKDSPCDGATSGLTTTGQVEQLVETPDIVPTATHSVLGQQEDIDGGKMDGFNLDPNCTHDLANCYNQYDALSGPCESSDGSCIPNYVALATHYTVSDRTFEAYATPSWAGHLVWSIGDIDSFEGTIPAPPTAGQPQPLAIGPGWGCDSGFVTPWGPDNVIVPSCVPTSSGSLGPNWVNYTGPRAPYQPTIFDELTAKGLSWKIYGGAGAPGKGTGFTGSGWTWAICPSFAECLYSAQRDNLVPATNILTDAADGQLPSYAIVTPTGPNSSHNDNSMSLGDDWIGEVMTALQASPEWSSTAVFITFDDCGCFYDHVNPLQYDSTWGIRVPMVIASPWAKLGYTDSGPTTFDGVLAFVEHTFGIAPLTSNDATEYDYSSAFCFNPQIAGCTPAGTTPVPMVDQPVKPFTKAQLAAQRKSWADDT